MTTPNITLIIATVLFFSLYIIKVLRIIKLKKENDKLFEKYVRLKAENDRVKSNLEYENSVLKKQIDKLKFDLDVSSSFN